MLYQEKILGIDLKFNKDNFIRRYIIKLLYFNYSCRNQKHKHINDQFI